MFAPAGLKATVLVCTYNRSALLRETLESLRAIQTVHTWEIVVVDNNSSDATREVVESFAAAAPIPVLYVFEPRQGKSHALNTGLARSRGAHIVFTDDDVAVVPEWLDQACRALDEHPDVDYVGGPVAPRWERTPPDFIDLTRSDLWGTLAILDYGPEPFVFEERCRVPLGVNMAVRRSLIEQIGGFHPDLGRRGSSLLGQEQAEFLARAQVHGVRGRYVPGMQVRHFVPASRLTKRYFRKWWYWKGVSRARVDAIHHRTELGLDLQTVPHLASVPRYVWGQIPRAGWGWLRSMAAGDRRAAMRHKMRIAYALGYVRACWAHQHLDPAPALTAGPETAPVAR